MDSDTHALDAPLADLERALIESYIRGRGVDAAALAALLPHDRDILLAEASLFASTRLAEIEARSHYLHDLHE
jgi:hypothetical protein